uniref:Sperm acrosome membrane-associated protein 6 n=1 Tax=Salvator merianae TaxID=96440 RepID=A0A8D0B7L2_SALMN
RGLHAIMSKPPSGSLLHFWLLALSSQAAACLLCFSRPQKRLRVCQIFYGHQSNQHKACQEKLQVAFQPYVKIQVGECHLIVVGLFSYPNSLPGFCFCCHPAGYQKEARQYQCSSCSMVDCQLPIDCPSTARTRELYFFQDMNFGYNPSLLIRPTLGSHHGSYVCEIAQGNEVLARKFFFLNGEKSEFMIEMGAELEEPVAKPEEVVVEESLPSLQEILYEPDSLKKKSVIFLIVGIALSSMLVTLVAV